MKTRTIKIRRVGGSLGAIFPKDLLEALHVGEGDELTVVQTERGLALQPVDPDFERAMDAFQVVQRQYRDTLRKLAE